MVEVHPKSYSQCIPKIQILKYVSKICALKINFEIVGVTGPCIRVCHHDRVELDFLCFVIKIALHLKSQGTEKIRLSSQGTYNFQILGNETLVIADYEYATAKIFQTVMLDIKL